MFSYPKIIEAAKKSGLPYNPTSTLRIGARTLSGKVSHHARGDAVDFWGESQDALAAYFLGLPHLEVFHKSKKTGRWYGSSNGNPVDEATHPDLVKQHENHLHVAATNEQMSGKSASNPVLGAISPIGGVIPNPFDAAATLVDVIRPIGIVANNVANPNFWRRIGMGIVGASFIMAGLLFLLGRKLEGPVGRVVGTAASGALQGFSFGLGASRAGMGVGSGAPAPAPTTGPYPPRQGPRALPEAPVTSVLPEAYAPVSPGGTYEVTTAGGSFKNPSPYRRPGAGSLIDRGKNIQGTGGTKKTKKGSQQTAFKPTITSTLKDT